MLALFDIEEIKFNFNLYKPLCNVVEFDIIINVISNHLLDTELDRGYKSLIWEVLESSYLFDDIIYSTGVTDDFLLMIDINIDMFSEFLYSYFSDRLNLDINKYRITNTEKIFNGLSVEFSNIY